MAPLLALVLVVACSGDDDADPPPTTEPTTSTSVVDLTSVVLPPVGGETTTTIDETGTARLVGTVRGPAGPLAGATVRIERLVAGRELRREVATAADGRWELAGVPGGRYRVRAYLPPRFAQMSTEVRFLADGEEHTFDLVVEDQRELLVRADVAPDQPQVDAPVNLLVVVAQRTVGADGIVRATPLSGLVVELAGLGRWAPRGDAPVVDPSGTPSTTVDDGGGTTMTAVLSEGRARFELQCLRAGAPGLSLRVPVLLPADPVPPASPTPDPVEAVEEIALELPACSAGATAAPSTTVTSVP